jgi:hypothetical protein
MLLWPILIATSGWAGYKFVGGAFGFSIGVMVLLLLAWAVFSLIPVIRRQPETADDE